VDTLLRDTEPLLRRAVGEAVTLVIAPSAPDCVVNIDPSQFEAALMNLAVNARDATPSGGMDPHRDPAVRLPSARVEALEAGDYLLRGGARHRRGMDAATIARAFEPFFTTKPPGRGTGLGLARSTASRARAAAPPRRTARPARAPASASTCRASPPTGAGRRRRRAAGRPRPGPARPAGRGRRPGGRAGRGHAARPGPRGAPAENADAALTPLKAGEPFDLLLTDLIMPGDKSGVDLAREAVRLRPTCR
jgi:hypothetical protein